MRIKIRLHSGKRINALAFPTSHPLLFVTPERIKGTFSPTGRGYFSENCWAITHKPSGYAVSYVETVDDAQILARFLGESGIPWEKLRSKKQAREYSRQFSLAKARFYDFNTSKLTVGSGPGIAPLEAREA